MVYILPKTDVYILTPSTSSSNNNDDVCDCDSILICSVL